jgi:hypothetical protein
VPDDLIPHLLDFGALGLFAGFLIWQYVTQQKRLDKRDAKQAKAAEAREEEARGRETAAREQTLEQAVAFQALIDSFATSLKTAEEAHDARVITMRERYDVVIREVRAEGAERLAECLRSRDELAASLTRPENNPGGAP